MEKHAGDRGSPGGLTIFISNLSTATDIWSVTFDRMIATFIVLCLWPLSSCIPPKPVPPPLGPHRITQVSVINALMIGRYEGVMPITELRRYGDFGVGTLDHLDGELILLDGTAYQVRGDGVIASVGPDRSTPFAVVTNFEQDGEFPCPSVGNLADLDARLDDALPQKNSFLAIRIDGRFGSMTLRSVHYQTPPFRPLAEVAKSQSVWTHGEVRGTFVGVRCPTWVGGLNVPGYHWHFLSDDRKVGGHVLDCRILEGQVRYDVCRDWMIKLDGSAELNGVDLGVDLRHEVHRVESLRGEKTRDGRSGP
jgi:acetolactate decarboxylase